MSWDFLSSQSDTALLTSLVPMRPAPGKISRTEQLPQRAASPRAAPDAGAPVQAFGGQFSLDAAFAPHLDAPVQCDGGVGEVGDIHAHAARGVSGSGGVLPHLEAIQQSFGHHDVSGVRAHVGGVAAEASHAIGAAAYATGDDVAFAGAPDLRQAAHEAAHVVQQRGGVRLDGGVGHAGDSYERHADDVAALVTRGESAEALLDTMAHRGASGGAAVQRLDADGDGLDDVTGMPVVAGARTGAVRGADATGGDAASGGAGARAEIDQALTRACDNYFNATGSVMGERARAIQDLGNAITNSDASADASLVTLAAKTALELATGSLGNLTGTLLSSGLASVSRDLAHGLDEFVKDFVSGSLEQAVDSCGELTRDAARSAARFQSLQGDAVSSASLAGREAFDGRRAAFYARPDGVDQANALATAYRSAAHPAYEAQWRTSMAQWNRLLTQTEGMGSRVSRNATGGPAPGVLTIEFDAASMTPSSATIPGLTAEARAMFVDRTGTLGDLLASGQVFSCKLVFTSSVPLLGTWRPFTGTDQATISVDSSGAHASPHTGLVEYANTQYGLSLDANTAFDVAAAIIWSRGMAPITIRALPAVGD